VMALELAELSRKTGLVVRSLDSAAVDMLFAELEEYDSHEGIVRCCHPFCIAAANLSFADSTSEAAGLSHHPPTFL
jgi:hypothetical protein